MTHRCLLCVETLTNNASGLCDDCEDHAMNDAEYEREAAADNARYEREQEEALARTVCILLGLDPDAECADGGVEAWMVMAKDIRDRGNIAKVRELVQVIQECDAAIALCDAIIDAAPETLKR